MKWEGGPYGPASDERRATKGNLGSALFRPPISDASSFLQTHEVSERFMLDSIQCFGGEILGGAGIAILGAATASLPRYQWKEQNKMKPRGTRGKPRH